MNKHDEIEISCRVGADNLTGHIAGIVQYSARAASSCRKATYQNWTAVPL